jgi:hypothetical protein
MFAGRYMAVLGFNPTYKGWGVFIASHIQDSTQAAWLP